MECSLFRITDDIFKNKYKLREIYMRNTCELFTNNTFINLNNLSHNKQMRYEKYSELEELNCSYCVITNKLFKLMSNLKILISSNCQNLTDEVVQNLNLIIWNCAHCPLITDQPVTNMKSLKYFD